MATEAVITIPALPSTVSGSLEATSPLIAAAKALVIRSAEDVVKVRDFCSTVTAKMALIDEKFDPNIKAWHAGHKGALALKKEFYTPCEEAIRIGKGHIKVWDMEQERLAEQARQKAQRDADALRQKQIQAAQAKIAKALEKAGSIEEKIAACNAVIEDENTSETELALAERQLEVFQLQLQGLEDKAREAQEKAQDIAEAPAYIPAAAVVEKTKGVSSKKVYIITSIDNAALIKAIAEGKGFPTLVKAWDETEIKRLAARGAFLPGVGYQEDRNVRIT